MKNIFKYTSGVLMAALSLIACSPEDYEGVSEAGLPVAEDAKVNIAVDQTTNQVTFTMDGAEIYPVWILPSTKSTTYSTVNGFKKIFANAGDYVVNYRVGNHNGISQGMGTTTFHVENSIVDFSKYTTLMCGKEWRIAKTEKNHLSCGEPGSNGTGWWGAAPNEKADKGVYDDVLTFDKDGGYVYNPGAGGTVYVNTGCTIFPDYHQSEDYMVPVDEQTSSYTLSVEGDNVYVTFPANTLVPYISSDSQYAEPKFRLESITPTQMILVYDNGAIAWQMIFTCGDEGFQGFTADSDCNMFKNCTFTNEYYYAPGWAQIADPEMKAEGNSYTVSLPTATSDTWQAQVKFHTDMTTNAVTNYDFSAKFMSTKDHNNVTVKLTKTGDDNTYYFVETIKLKAYEDYVFYKSDMPGIDMDNVSLVLDFGGNEAGTDVTISKIDLQEHKCDGVEAPAEDEDKTVYTYDASSNLWKSSVDDLGASGFSTFFFYAPGWTELSTPPDFAADNGKYTFTLPTATDAQWQAQCHLITNIPGEADTKYDFYCKLLPTKDIKGVTVKLTDTADDNNFFFAERVDLTAGTETIFKMPACVLSVGAAPALKLVFDFGGNPADEEISAYNIILQKTAE